MPLVNLYFAPVLVLLVLTCPLWQAGQSLPVISKGPMADSCVSYAQTLLQNITDVLTVSDLFSGIDCTKQSMELYMETNTASVCVPKESKCLGILQTKFDEVSCLTNIGEDLQHYYKFLAAQPDPSSSIRPTVLFSLRELMESCFAWSLPTDLASEKPATDHTSTYDERLSLCKVLKGFQVRAITINRVIAYMNSGEHVQ